MVPLTASIVMMSPSRSSAIGPPSAASGPTWPMQKPRVAPEKRPSVMSATLPPVPCPVSAAVRALVADDEYVAFLVGAVLHRLETGFLAVEAARRSGELQRLQAGDLHD